MKNKARKFRVGKNTYFHHKHGVFVPPRRGRSLTAGLAVFIMLFGGFFIGHEYAIPMLRSNGGLQRMKQIAYGESIVSAQADPKTKSAEPIRQEDDLLKSVLEDKIATYGEGQEWSVFVYDLNTQRTVNINTEKMHTSASLYKLFMIEALEKKVPFDQWQWTWVGGMPIAECVDTMLRSSDNPCAQELGDYIGWENIDKINLENGFKNTKFSGTNGRETTASDVGELFTKLKKGQILSDYARRSVFDSLYQQTQSKGMAKACKKCRTANKLGELNGIAHDAGIVTHGSHSYVLVLMSKGGNFKQITELAKIVELKLAPSTP